MKKLSSKKTLLLVFYLIVLTGYAKAQPANDNPCNATPVPVGTSCTFTQYTNVNATATAGVTAPGCANYQGADVWFSAVVPASGSISFDTNTGGITDGGMAIYSGTCGALTLMDCNDDGSANGFMPSLTENGLTPGTTVFIRFWGYGNNNTGTFSICAQAGPTCSGSNSNATCATASPFCTGVSYDYCNTTGVPSIGGSGIYDCLLTAPNPAFFFMNIATSGPVTFNISQQTFGGVGIDVDFVLWGPFASQGAVCAGISAANAIDCSYSTAAVETATIPNAIAGQWYMVLITNFSDQPGVINFSQTNSGNPGAGVTNCNIVTATPGACLGGFYTLTGAITVPAPPATGTLTVTNSCSGSQVLSAPFTSPINYSIPGICGNGNACNVSAVFSAAGAPVVLPTSYTAPSCNTLTATPGSCVAGGYVLSGSLTTGCLPATGTLTISSSCGGSVVFNAPFASPQTWSLPVSNGTGGSCTVTAVYSAAGAPVIIPFTFTEPSCCGSDAGTVTVTHTGGTQTVLAGGTIRVVLCPGGTVKLNSSDDYTLPGAGCAGCTPGLMYAIYAGTGPTVPDPDLDPNWTGYFWTGENFNTANSGGLNTNTSGSCSPLLTLPAIAGFASPNAPNNTLMFVPITADATNLPNHDANGDGCFDIGDPIAITFLNPVSFSPTPGCNGSVSVNITGGYPQFFPAFYALTNTGAGTLASNTIPSGGNAVISGLTPGQTYSFSVNDGNGCTATFSGVYSGNPIVTITPASPTVCTAGCINLVGNVTSGVGAGNQTFTSNQCANIPDAGIGAANNPPTVANAPNWAHTSISVAGVCAPAWNTGDNLTVCLNITHTFAADLNIYLQAPNGVYYLLSDDNGGVGANYTGTCFSATAATAITAGTAPFSTGPYKPEGGTGNFAGLSGTTINGSWSLWIADDAAGDVGTLNNWSITFTNQNTYTYVWSPAAGLSATNILNPNACPAATTTYSLTVTNSCGCPATANATVTVTSSITPTFNAVPAICSGSAAPVLPTTSTNGITGTWAPAVSNTASGTYTFTPAAGQCATTATLTVTVNPNTTPTFNAVPAICSGSAAPVLPTTSTNGITGTWAPSAVNNTVSATYTFTPDAGQCAVQASVTVTVNTNTIPTFNAVPAICSGSAAPVLPTTSTNGITGTWVPAVVDNTATATYTFTPAAGQCATTTTLTVTVNPLITPTFTAVAAICSGDALTALPTTSNNGINGTWAPALDNTATTTYTFTPTAGQCATTTTLTITVNPLITPTFTAVAAICSGDALAALPTTSNNGINGTWAPALNNTATTTYTFTPTAGQCATTTTLTITVNPLITPTFTAVAAICSGDALAALPTTSNNGINGTWAPALDNTATTTYTFTPTAGQCATTTTLTITVNPLIIPTFNAVAAICSGDALAALPTTSNNGINGTWAPALDNTATTTYTFTPIAGQCALTTTLTITVNPLITPTFTAVAAICSGDALAALPTTSNNGINGTWAPALDNTATTTYTFTPTAGQCSLTTTLTITVNPLITPTFNAVAAICSGDPISVLPTTSNNGITGTWIPGLNNTVTTTYTFTPTAGQCALTTTLTITVNPLITPTFTAVASICSGDALAALPTTSNNGINGTWAPALDNTATTTYTFTPTAGQCALTTTLTITVNPLITPTFTAVAAICSGDALAALPTTSNNGINGTWAPALDNTTTTTYTFTPTAGQCATTTTLTITVNPLITPTFNAVAAICSGDPAPVLPTTSTNGVTGTWTPPAVSNTTSATYTFVPDPGQCGVMTTLQVTVNPLITPTFTAVAAICSGDALAALPTTSNNGINGTWAPALDNTTTTTYTFTPTAGQCATTTTLTITVNPLITPTFTAVAAICSGDALAALPTTSNNGINGTWAPALDNTATTTYTFTPTAGQCATTTTLTITVNPLIIPTFNAVAAICSGDALAALPTTSNNGINGTWAPALDNTATTTYTFTPIAGQCALTTTLTITVNPLITPTFTAVAAICSGDALAALPTTSNNGINGTWAPALDNTATTTYTFTPTAGQCSLTTTLTITVNPLITPTFNAVAAICSGDPISVLPTTSNNGITGTWIPGLNNTVTTTYTFTPTAGQCALTTTLTITVNPLITPTFTAVASICSGDALAALPTTSNNGINGTWAPALDNTATTTYTFTPTAGQCALTTTLTITVNPLITPTFTAVAAICSGDALAALPTTSNNGINGTWAPALDNTTTTTYTFTPTAGQCATTTTLTITVNPLITPTFNAVAAICSGDPISVLPTTSNNGIIGTWIPALNNTVTTTYTFTPTAGQCSLTTTLTITVNPLITPTFNAVAAICSGDPISVLPTTSNNGITGTWIPALNNTVTTTYTFTPTAGQCALTTTLTITVNPLITPTFTAVAATCSGDALAALPTTSNNGINGTWAPALNNTATTTYTFTPTAGQCATTTTLTITVNPLITPTFNAVAAICSGDPISVLPTTSNNGITGTWIPALNNTVTTTYTFTPTAGQCALTTTLTITVNPLITPTFTAVAAICSGDPAPVLPTTSTNGVTGTWTPPAVSNTTSATYTFVPDPGQCGVMTTLQVTVNPLITPTFTAVAAICSGDALAALPTTSNNGINGTWAPALDNTATTTYTFTPTAGQCALTTTLTITVNPLITPTFTAVAAICSGDPISVLPTTSNNGIIGTWIPALNNTVTTTYTFTPTAGQCSLTTTLTITVNPLITPTFNAVAAICSGDPISVLPTTSNNGITGTWIPALNNTATTTYTFTPTAGQCALTTTLTITVNPLITPTFTAVADICSGDALAALPTTSNNGINGTWTPALDNTATTTYTFTPTAGQCALTTTLTITVNPLITPTFTAVADICSSDALAALPTTSNNGINGTWAPALDNTATTTYTFTPTAGQCALTTTLTITVNPLITPTFTAVAAICSGDALTALPTTSNNGINGTWAPALNNTATTTYTFTPTSGQCATTTTLTITVNPILSPTINCGVSSTSSVTFNWAAVAAATGYDLSYQVGANPIVNTGAIGNTLTYTVSGLTAGDNVSVTITPTGPAGTCFMAASTICTATACNPPTASINYATPFCASMATAQSVTLTGTGAFTGGTYSALPGLTIDATTGDIIPATSTPATYIVTYTIAASAGCSIVTATTSVTIDAVITPTFATVATMCAGMILDPLPVTSPNGIHGTWSPTLNNTTTTTYTFTPTAGQCALTTTLTITVNPLITPTFTAVAAICSGDALTALPTTSNNGINGTWAPALDNTATTTYTFTPTAGQCATTTTLTITVNPLITPTFTAVAAICSGDVLAALPTTSNNGINGTWAPALNNTATTTYTFTPTAGQCATTTTLTITVNPLITPTFTAVAAICSGDALTALPTTSNNGINGTWAPALNNTATTTYTFTPTSGQCATTTTLTITVNPILSPTINCGVSSTSSVTFNWAAVAAATGYDLSYQVGANPIVNTGAIGNTLTYTVSGLTAGDNVSVTITPTGPAGTCFMAASTICTATACNPPTANISYATPFCGSSATAQSVTLTGTGAFTGGTYSALPGLTIDATTGDIIPATSTPATYIVTYTITASAGCSIVTATTSVTIDAVITPTFTPVTAICSGDALAALPTTSNNGINGTWAPALDNTATTTYTFTPTAGQCATTTTLTITVNPLITPTFTAVAAICSGDALTALPTTSNNGINGTWAPALNNTATTTYTFTPTSGQCATTTTLTITVNPILSPTINCGVSSTSSVTFNWAAVAAATGYDLSYQVGANPIVNTGAIGNTLTYTVSGLTAGDNVSVTITPTGPAGTCFMAASTICTATACNPPTASINYATPFCASMATAQSVTLTGTGAFTGGTYSALPGLTIDATTGDIIPATSTPATYIVTYTIAASAGCSIVTATTSVTIDAVITPTFATVATMCAGMILDPLPVTSPNGIHGTWSPTLNNTTTTTYTFTPNAGQCALSTTLTITVNPLILPTFNTVVPICTGSAAPVLPTTSLNGITGTWSPATVDNTATATYTFTPDAGQCGTTATLTVTVTSSILPTFNTVAPICTGSAAPVLPTTSLNGITGTWSPATVDNTATATYTFTPDAGQCGTTATLTVTVTSSILPTFNTVAPICTGSAAPVLPTTSLNGITGTWSPATVDNTATATYTFTPDAGQCGTTATLAVTVTSSILPTFNTVAPICTGSAAPVLPTTSLNGMAGTWSPATVDNTATATYTFTPDAGQCGTTATLTVTVTSSILPTFNTVAPICTGSAAPVLPTTSLNGITGTWSPATVDNTATATYTFTPDAGQCGTTATLAVTVTSSILPTFNTVAPICTGSAAPVLPTTSLNGITGTWSPATVDNTATATYTFTPDAGQCGTTATLTVTVTSSILPTFNTVAPICTGSVAPVLPTTSLNGITGTWSPATVDNTATATYTFTPDAGQCGTTATLTVTVTSSILPTFNTVAPICTGSAAPVLPTTSLNGITGTWSPATVDNTATGTYTFTPDAGQCGTTATLTVTVTSSILPTFNTVAPICTGSAAPVLPPTSLNGITGTWSPATVDNTATATYTFTPDAGQCGTTATLTVTVTSSILPTFNTVAPICTGSAAPVLPTISLNGITGTWSPATVDNTATATYTFTPDAGQCGTTATLTVTVTSSILPTFNTVAPICTGSAAPVLPTTSLNGITGTWSPATVDNTATATYTFTPDAGQCGTTATLAVIVTSSILPTFNTVAPICTGSAAPVLPTTSLNGITGTWSPATVDNTATGTYTFTPDAGQCGTTATLTVTVTSSILPTFNTVAPICTGSAAPVLPTTSLNGITGTWSPATVDNTATATYTFTPDAGQCGTTATLTVTVTSSILPTFNTVAPICTGSAAPVLPTTSLNGITGTWSPVTVDNTATATYTFTPDAGQCGTTATLTVTVTSSILPTFNTVAPICTGSAAPVLPTTSLNGITGTWSPATVDNTATATYTFTPDAGQCGTTATLAVTVNPSTTPTFSNIPAICSGSPAPVLPTTSNNGITGTWSPVISNTATGIYTFTPDAGQCATTATLTVTVNPSTTPTFSNVPAICSGSAAPVLPTTSNNGITGTWSPVISNTATGIYTFTPDAGQCAATATLTVTVNPSTTPTFSNVPAICSGSAAPVLPTTSNNGITGTWTPANVSNTTTGTYTFTAATGQCITTATLVVTVVPVLTPAFNIATSICSGSVAPTLPATSTNGITGIWAPATVSNTTTGIYTFTPAAGQCGTTATLAVTVNQNVIPVFSAVAPICSGSAAPVLPATSINGITGTWLPATVDNTATGTYTFTPDAGQCATTATLSVTVNPAPALPAVISPVTYCQHEATAQLSATVTTPGSQLVWYTSPSGGTGSSTAPTPSSSTAGTTTYYVSQLNGSCEGPGAIITVTVNVKPDLTDQSIKICFGQTANLAALYNVSGLTTNWTFNQQPVADPSSVNVAGSYQLIVATPAGCSDTALVSLGINPPVTANAGVDDNAEYNAPYQLTGSGGIQYQWSPSTGLNNPNIASPQATLIHDETYILMAMDDIGCFDLDTVHLRVLNGPTFYVPTAFTPNGDGLNDIFRPTAVGIASLEYFSVFNRYGELVFETADLTKGWDGTYKGKRQPIDNYVWKLKGTDRNGVIKIMKGNVVLIR